MAAPTPRPDPDPDPDPVPEPDPVPDPDPVPRPVPESAVFRRWLTPDERKLPRAERIALRRHRKWPDGRPVWLARTERAAVAFAWDVLFLLVEAAKRAVMAAAVAVAAGGQARHEFAVAALLAVAVGEAIDLATGDAAGLIEEAFEVLTDEGALDSQEPEPVS